MATITSNVVINGFRGKLGDALVFKTMRGKTFASMPARKPDKQKETTAQRATRVTFRQAVDWAQTILLDPGRKAYYIKRAKAMKLPNAYTAALTDYMRKPKLKEVNYSAGSTTYTVSKKDLEIRQVTIQLSDVNGDVKETRTLQQIRGKAVGFKLTDAERQAGVSVYVSDQAERITTWRIDSVPKMHQIIRRIHYIIKRSR